MKFEQNSMSTFYVPIKSAKKYSTIQAKTVALYANCSLDIFTSTKIYISFNFETLIAIISQRKGCLDNKWNV